MAGADLHGIDFTSPNGVKKNEHFCGMYLGVDFRNATLVGANFSRTDVSNANLRGTDLRTAKMVGCNLYNTLFESANLAGADLRQANLYSAELQNVNVNGANFAGARFGQTSIGAVDLSAAVGLDKVVHVAPSVIGSDTLELTAAGLSKQPHVERTQVLTFLRKAGVHEELLSIVRAWIGQPIEFYSCFISYSHSDRSFSRRLHDTLQGLGIGCWLDEHELKPGDRILDVVDRAIRVHDRILICCSSASLSSWWVKDELRKAMDRERREGRDIIIPLMLDTALLQWQDGLASDLRSRLAANFTDWERDNALFEREFERVVKALRSSETAPESSVD